MSFPAPGSPAPKTSSQSEAMTPGSASGPDLDPGSSNKRNISTMNDARSNDSSSVHSGQAQKHRGRVLNLASLSKSVPRVEHMPLAKIKLINSEGEDQIILDGVERTRSGAHTKYEVRADANANDLRFTIYAVKQPSHPSTVLIVMNKHLLGNGGQVLQLPYITFADPDDTSNNPIRWTEKNDGSSVCVLYNGHYHIDYPGPPGSERTDQRSLDVIVRNTEQLPSSFFSTFMSEPEIREQQAASSSIPTQTNSLFPPGWGSYSSIKTKWTDATDATASNESNQSMMSATQTTPNTNYSLMQCLLIQLIGLPKKKEIEQEKKIQQLRTTLLNKDGRLQALQQNVNRLEEELNYRYQLQQQQQRQQEKQIKRQEQIEQQQLLVSIQAKERHANGAL